MALASAIPGLTGTVIDVKQALADAASAAPSTYSEPLLDGDDLGYVMYTSGSTGRPKGVSIAHRSIARVVLDQNYVDFNDDDIVLHTSSIAFDTSTFEIWGALLNGCTLAIVHENFSLAELSRIMKDTDTTIAFLTTGLFNLFADYPGGDLPKLRHMLFAGDVGSAVHSQRFLRNYPHTRLTNAYGPTEAAVFATAFDVPAGFPDPDLPIGKAISHTGIFVLDEALNEVATGTEGQLAISGDGLAIDYFRSPERTAEKFVMVATKEGTIRCYLTGDIAALQADCTVTFKGRRDRQIKINGKRIELDGIEAALRNDPMVSDAIVVCQKQGLNFKRVVAFVRPKHGSETTGTAFADALMSRLGQTLPPFMLPSSTVVVETFPLTPSGKVDRSKLVPPPIEEITTPEGAQAGSETEALLATLWREALSADHVDLNSNFFDLGGTSLQLMQVHAAIEAKLQRTVEIILLFKHPSIRDLARHLDGSQQTAAPSIAAASRAALQRKNMSQFRRNAP
jgi:amino acid adenylation domain-containing protein